MLIFSFNLLQSNALPVSHVITASNLQPLVLQHAFFHKIVIQAMYYYQTWNLTI